MKDLEDGWDQAVFSVDYDETKETLLALIPDTEDRFVIVLLKDFNGETHF